MPIPYKRLSRQATRLAGLCLFSVTALPVWASSALSSQQLLEQFNLMVFGNTTSYQEVAGRAYVGGSASGGTYAAWGQTLGSSSYAGLTVQGSASGVSVQNGGAVVGGAISNSTINNGSSAILGSSSNTSYNGSGTTYVAGSVAGGNLNQPLISDLSQSSLLSAEVQAAQGTSTSDYQSQLVDLSQQLSTLSATGSTSVSGNKVTFTATAGSDGVAVIDLTGSASSLLTSYGEFQFDVASDVSTLIFNVTGDSLSLYANFLAGSAQQLATNTIWNFIDTSSLTLSSQFGGTILAPYANLTNSNEIWGGVFVNNLTQYGAIRDAGFTGSVTGIASAVPEPAYGWLLGLGMLGLWWRQRRA
ncbi:choice-of-anchor A family protein [Pseudaeromonas paramecii]|uniref:Choice-of-anchor A family protein n=1 Tax=Pseudaeromonas paramecii TaxID=2138166 RepID=A0ABP8Q132_9GAMM